MPTRTPTPIPPPTYNPPQYTPPTYYPPTYYPPEYYQPQYYQPTYYAWDYAWGYCHCFCPIILDLAGSSVLTTSFDHGVVFDFEGDGDPVKSAWAAPNSGLLVRDLNGNGRIDNGSELFGNYTILKNGALAGNGFEALAEFDLNGDGLVDRAEAKAAGILIWIDANTNGKADPGELLTFEQADVFAIETNYKVTSQFDKNHNLLKWIGTFIRSDGSKAPAIDVIFISE